MSAEADDEPGDGWPPGDTAQRRSSPSDDTAIHDDPVVLDDTSPASRATLLGRLARLVAVADRQQSLPERLAEACRRLLAVDGAAITLQNTTPDRITLWSTDRTAARIEDLQDVIGQGPSQLAYSQGTAVTTTLGHDDQRWPEFAAAAQELFGDLTIAALPISPNRMVIGVLTVHRSGSRSSPPSAAAQFLADAIGAALLEDAPHGAHPPEAGPWSSRAEVHQAAGMVTAQLGIPPSDSLAILRAHAFAHDTTLHNIAAEVLAGRLDFGSDGS